MSYKNSQPTHELTIREVSQRTGIPTSTLRYYEEKALIKSIGRRGITRVFRGQVIEQLALISLARSAGFSLDEIAKMFNLKGQLTIDRQQLLAKANLIDNKIQQLNAMRDGLIHVANCPEENQLACRKFKALTVKAARRQLQIDHPSISDRKTF